MTDKYSFTVEWRGGSQTFSDKRKAQTFALRQASNGVPCSLYMYIKGQPNSTSTHIWDYTVCVWTVVCRAWNDKRICRSYTTFSVDRANAYFDKMEKAGWRVNWAE